VYAVRFAPDGELLVAGGANAELHRCSTGCPARPGLNIAHEAVDPPRPRRRADHVAIRWLGKDDEIVELTYRQLTGATDRLRQRPGDWLGVVPGERVFLLLGRVPELYVAALGRSSTGRSCPLFSAFGPEPIRQRLELGSGRVLVTSRLYERKVAGHRDQLPGLEHVLLVDATRTTPPPGRPTSSRCSPTRRRPTPSADRPRGPGAPALHQRDDRTAEGRRPRPRGRRRPHATARLALDLHPDDVFWCTADPGGSPAPRTGSSRR
jgi:acetyl-CoA synthetase